MQVRQLIQLAGATGIIMVMSIIEFISTGVVAAPFYVLNWLLGLSLFFWVNRDDSIINSLLVTTFLPIIFLEVLLFASGFFYDVLHLPILIVTSYILLRKRDTINFLSVVILSFIVTIWLVLVITLGYAYTPYFIHWSYVIIGVPINTDLATVIIYPLLILANLGIIYLMLRVKPRTTIVLLTSSFPSPSNFQSKSPLTTKPQEQGVRYLFRQLAATSQSLVFAAYISAAYFVGFWVYGTPYMPLVLCIWWFGGSLVYLINSHNITLNSYMASSMVPMILFLAESLMRMNPYGFDWEHLLPLAVVFSIFYYNRPIKLKLLWLFTGIEVVWFLLVQPIVYATMQPFLFVFCALMNSIVVTLLLRYRSTRALRIRQYLQTITAE
jgi:hypothetical protein